MSNPVLSSLYPLEAEIAIEKIDDRIVFHRERMAKAKADFDARLAAWTPTPSLTLKGFWYWLTHDRPKNPKPVWINTPSDIAYIRYSDWSEEAKTYYAHQGSVQKLNGMKYRAETVYNASRASHIYFCDDDMILIQGNRECTISIE